MDHAKTEGYIDLYKCGDASLAERAVRLLHRAGIAAVSRPVTSNIFPSAAVDDAHVVAVDGGHLDAARRCLRGAADDGVIPGDVIF